MVQSKRWQAPFMLVFFLLQDLGLVGGQSYSNLLASIAGWAAVTLKLPRRPRSVGGQGLGFGVWGLRFGL